MATPMHSTASSTRRLRRALPLALALALAAGCQSTAVVDGGFVSPVSPNGALTSTKLVEASGQAVFKGTATGPQGIAGANIISNNGSAIVSNNGSAIISNNGSTFVSADRRVLQAGGEAPVENAIVYLTDPDERFFAAGGKPITTFTSSTGVYEFTKGLPADQIVIVNVMLADNRREVGFAISKPGKNTVDISVASTYVTEFLRDRARALGKKMSDFDLNQLPELTRLTRAQMVAVDTKNAAAVAAVLAKGQLPATPDLTIGKINDMNQVYAQAVGRNQALGDAWAKTIGSRVVAVTTFAGTGETGLGGNGKAATAAQLYKPKGIARDKDGNYYIAEEGNHMVRKVDAKGIITTFAGTGNPAFTGDDGPAGKAGLWWPRTVAIGPDGQLYIADTLNMRIRRVDLASGIITTFAGNPDQANGSFLNDFGGDGGPADEAKLAGPRGFAWDSKGGLVFTDSWDNADGSWHHIRRIDPDGTIDSLVGTDGVHGFNGDGKPGRETQINYVHQVAIDAKDNIYFTDSRNHRIRKYDAASKVVVTVAGNGQEGTPEDGKLATQTALNAPYGVAFDKAGRMFIADRGVRRILMVDKDGKIRTLVGGGDYSLDGEARAISLSEPHDLFFDPDGNLLFCDSRAAKVRKIWLQYGL